MTKEMFDEIKNQSHVIFSLSDINEEAIITFKTNVNYLWIPDTDC